MYYKVLEVSLVIKLNEKDLEFVESFLGKINAKLSKSAVEFRDIIPYTAKNGRYTDMAKSKVSWWTNGFFAGLMWLMYEKFGNEEYKITAVRQQQLLDAAFCDYENLIHDTGFMWGLASKADYLLTGSREAKLRSFYAASLLASRVNVKGGFIRAWNGEKKTYSIIDCMMNLPLLYWASEELSDDRFKYIAQKQADMTAKEHIREDGSAVHICVHDDTDGTVTETLAGQGYSVGSTWSRGQAWAIYGFVLSYVYTKDGKYLAVSRKCADWFIRESEKRAYRIPCDFNQPNEVGYVDNSAAAIAAAGLAELYRHTWYRGYLDAALKILRALETDCVFDGSKDYILGNCMQAYDLGEQIDMIYGDFFLAEALIKLHGSDFLIW